MGQGLMVPPTALPVVLSLSRHVTPGLHTCPRAGTPAPKKAWLSRIPESPLGLTCADVTG